MVPNGDDEGGADDGRPTIVIIGGGFGGLNAAKGLRRADADVYLIDRENYHLFQPLLYQVATAGLQAGDIASPIRTILKGNKNTKVVKGEVYEIDRQRREVRFDHGRLRYDYLIVSAGMKTNYFGNDEWKALAPGLKTLGDALECRRRILDVFEQAEWTDDDDLAEALLTFVIVGAGPTGVEMAGAIRDIAHEVMVRDFRNIDPANARVILVDAGPRVLAAYHDDSSEQALRDLEAMDVEVWLDSMVEEITADGVRIDGEFVATETVIWAAGVEASPLGKSLDAELDRMGRVVVESDLTIPGDDRVYVIGDQAHVEGDDGEPLPGLAPVAIQQGKYVAKDLRRRFRDKDRTSFAYKDKGQMATLGRARAVAEIGRRQFGGFLAWLLWLFVHLLFLIGFRNRLFVMMDWFYAYVGMKRSSRLILETPESYRERMRDRTLPRLEDGEGETRLRILDAEHDEEEESEQRVDGSSRAEGPGE